MSNKSSDPLYVFLVFFVLIEYIATVAVSYLATSDPLGWFESTQGNRSDEYPTLITPASWAFSIWGLIFIWQALWITYVVINLVRTNKFGKVYLNPPTTSRFFLVVFALNLGLNIGWLFLWDRELFPIACVDLALVTFTAYLCLWLNHRAVVGELEQLRRHQVVDLWLNRILIQNGITVYATWCTIATLLNLTVTITYNAGLDPEKASYIALSVLVGELILYFILDIFIWDKYLRTTFMVYPVVIWATVAATLGNWNPASPVSIYTAVVAGLACAAFVVKMIVLVVRALRERTNCGSQNTGMSMGEVNA